MAQTAVSPLGSSSSSSSAALRLAGFLPLLVLLLSGPGGRFALAASPADRTPAKCLLTGTWVNDLGSQMNISAVEDGGVFTGTYLTAVTATSNSIQRSPLYGSQNYPSNRAQPTLGFTVHWSFSDSVTVFTGQCFVDADGHETLETAWLLRSEAENHGDNWKATRVGSNTFLRVK